MDTAAITLPSVRMSTKACVPELRHRSPEIGLIEIGAVRLIDEIATTLMHYSTDCTMGPFSATSRSPGFA